MRKRTVKKGINMVTGGIALIIMATFFHEQVADFLHLSHSTETRLIFAGLFWGGCTGCLGIVTAAIGTFQTESRQDLPVFLIPSLVILCACIILFFVLLYSSFRTSVIHPNRPGETIVI